MNPTMLHASRLIQCASFLALSTLFCASALHAACRPFAVVGDDASYLQFDPDDWSIQALGNFWNVGVRQVEAIVAGTSFPRPAFITREFVSIFDRQPMIDEPQSPLEGPFAAVVLGANPRPMRHFNGYAWVEATYFQRSAPPTWSGHRPTTCISPNPKAPGRRNGSTGLRKTRCCAVSSPTAPPPFTTCPASWKR